MNDAGDPRQASRAGGRNRKPWLEHLVPEKIGGRIILPPTPDEVEKQRLRYRHSFIENLRETTAFRDGKIVVQRDQATKTLTLRARGKIYGPLDYQAAAAAMRYYDGLSYKDADGYLYRSDVKFVTTKIESEADIRLLYVPQVDGRQDGVNNGTVHMDIKDRNGLPSGTVAHEIGHAFFGIVDAYFKFEMPSGYYVYGAVYPGFETSLMANTTLGAIRGEDLKVLILKYEDMQVEAAAKRNTVAVKR